jgi:hypothetical protein
MFEEQQPRQLRTVAQRPLRMRQILVDPGG